MFLSITYVTTKRFDTISGPPGTQLDVHWVHLGCEGDTRPFLSPKYVLDLSASLGEPVAGTLMAGGLYMCSFQSHMLPQNVLTPSEPPTHANTGIHWVWPGVKGGNRPKMPSFTPWGLVDTVCTCPCAQHRGTCWHDPIGTFLVFVSVLSSSIRAVVLRDSLLDSVAVNPHNINPSVRHNTP